MKLPCQLLMYLDQSPILFEMKSSAENYLHELIEKTVTKFPPFRFHMEIDVLRLSELYPEVGEWLLKEPMQFQRACSEMLFACVQSLTEENRVWSVEPAQVAVNLRVRCVPQVTPRRDAGLTSCHGLLLSVSKRESYVYHTVWSCPEECEGNEVILHYIPKVPPKCCMCKSVQFENSGFRRCGERVTATFRIRNCLLPKSFMIVDDLIPKLKLGSNYNIHAVTVKKSTKVWGLEEMIPLIAPITSPIPLDIKDLYRACKGIPWQFIYCVASSIGVKVCPLHCFMHLKICLLLSLASVRANIQRGSTIVHVLAAGYDTGYVGRLMEKAAKLASRAVSIGTSNTTASASTALIGSSGGVCVMPLPLHSYHQKQTATVLSAIETGEITTETSKVKLRSAVWAQGMDFKKIFLLNVGSVFGTVCRGDYGEYNDEIVDFILQNAVEPEETSKEEVQTVKDVVKYIDIVAGIDVSLDALTENLLRQYFLAARRERPRGVMAGSMGALVAACLTIARVCRRATASVDDAVFAIWLHVCSSPEPRFAPEEYLQAPADVKRLQKVMTNFKDWLEQFTGTCIS